MGTTPLVFTKVKTTSPDKGRHEERMISVTPWLPQMRELDSGTCARRLREGKTSRQGLPLWFSLK